LVLVYNFLKHPQGVHSYDYLVTSNQCSWNTICNIWQLKNIFEHEIMDDILANDSIHFVS